MLQQVRNDGSRGIASMAISGLDVALWDLKAKLLGSSLADLLGAAREVWRLTEVEDSPPTTTRSWLRNSPAGSRKV